MHQQAIAYRLDVRNMFHSLKDERVSWMRIDLSSMPRSAMRSSAQQPPHAALHPALHPAFPERVAAGVGICEIVCKICEMFEAVEAGTMYLEESARII
jgi:hypothetical protein